MIQQIAAGCTDFVLEYLAAGHPANSTDAGGVSLIKWCAYYGDVSAIKFLLANGESIDSLGDNLGLIAACFYGHWRLCQFPIKRGADLNSPLSDTGETPRHSSLCKSMSPAHDLVVKLLLANGATPNCVTKESVETGCFMRDCRTKGETPLHRATAFACVGELVFAAASLLRKLCHGNFRIRPDYSGMDANLRGKPHL